MLTVSQMMAQKRAQKQEREMKAQAKNVKVGNTKKMTNNSVTNRIISSLQTQNLTEMAIQIGTDLYDTELIEKEQAERIAAYENLIYRRNMLETMDYFEHMANMVHLFGVLRNHIPTTPKPNDTLWHNTANAATACFAPPSSNWGESPNQRREHFAPVLEMVKAMYALQKVMPQKIGGYFSEYSTTVIMTKSMIKLFTRHNPKVIDSLFQIIQGNSLRQSAKFHGIKESQLREEVIIASTDLWKLANCYQRLPVASSIPELRQEAWKPYADTNFIRAIIKKATDTILLPFESHTGISLINHEKFKRDLIEIEKRFS